MNMFKLTSDTWRSCEYTRKASGQAQVPLGVMLSPEDRRLRAKLIMEEALETIEGLGFDVKLDRAEDCGYSLVESRSPDMEKIIDGCCDLEYVTIGTLNALSIPDIPHMQAVCKANEAKFPDGKGVPHPTIPGKYGKPEGWIPPNHAKVAASYMQTMHGESHGGIGE